MRVFHIINNNVKTCINSPGYESGPWSRSRRQQACAGRRGWALLRAREQARIVNAALDAKRSNANSKPGVRPLKPRDEIGEIGPRTVFDRRLDAADMNEAGDDLMLGEAEARENLAIIGVPFGHPGGAKA